MELRSSALTEGLATLKNIIRKDKMKEAYLLEKLESSLY
jgi:hypothetical protein